jgi:hypothetical protein
MLTLDISHPVKPSHPVNQARTVAPGDITSIHVRVAGGWVISGHYRDNSLQTIILQKPAAKEAK